MSRALAALLALIVCAGSLDWGHAGGDDPDCNPVLVHHDHSAHRFSSAPSQTEPTSDHCYICHSLRLLQTTLIPRGARELLAVNATPVWQTADFTAPDTTDLARSPRAPPALSL